MTSEPTVAYVWAWLPGAVDPVPAARLDVTGDVVTFTWGNSYLARDDAISLYTPEVPLRRGRIRPVDGLPIPGCIADAGPDAWGQRVILRRLLGRVTRDTDPAQVGPLTYLLESGSDRIGALDFQASPTEYVPRLGHAPLEELIGAAERLEAGEPFTPDLDAALLHGTSIGGARPKVLVDDGERKLIAKLSSRHDPYPVVKAEGVAMALAQRVGLDVAPTEVTEVLHHDVLLVERFDRAPLGARRMLVSALTILGLHEMIGRYATYPDLADAVRSGFTEAPATLRELFSRIVFNICVGNTDDHARNHAAFWDGHELTLTPAYDICPQARSGGVAAQAMAIGRDGYRMSQLAGCVDAAEVYLLERAEARDIIDAQLATIRTEWGDAADGARLTVAARQQLWARQILNPYVLEGW